VALVALLAIVGAAGLRLSQVASQLRDAQDELRGAEAAVRDGELAQADSRLNRAQHLVTAANGSLHTSAILTVASTVPILRQNLAALKRSVAVTLILTDGGRRVLEAARPLQGADGRLHVSLQGGAIPLAPAREVSQILREVAFSLPPAPAENRWLVGPVRKLGRDVAGEADRRKQQFLSVGRGLQLLTELAGGNGSRRYMLAVANAAEMRGTGGMILSYGSLTSDAGKITLERFGPIDDIPLDKPVDVTDPPDYVRRFASLEPTRLWRSTNLAADFTEVAPVMEKMYPAATGDNVDGVIQIDSAGLAAILEGIGPIDVPNLGTVDAGNVVALTLNDAYVKFPDRPVRQEYLEAVARVAFDRLLSGNYPSVTALARALVKASAGRHVILHAASPAIERLAATLGADGSLPPEGINFAALTVQNLSGNKLDYYLDTNLGITGGMRPGRASQVQLRVDLTNTAPAGGAPQYIFGPFSSAFRNGEYRGLASVYLPMGAALRSQRGASDQPTVTAEQGRTVVSFGVDVQAGQTASVTLDVTLPPQPPVLQGWELVPVPRVRPTTVALRLDTPKGAVRFNGPADRRRAFATR
jgi:hypothetical protein